MMIFVLGIVIILVTFLYLFISFSTSSDPNIVILKKPLKLQSKVDEWNQIYGNIDISSFTLGHEPRKKKISFVF
jgi:hypothetical protein